MSAYMWILGSSRWLPVHRHMEGRTEPADQEEEEAPLLPCFSGEQTVGSGGRRAGLPRARAPITCACGDSPPEAVRRSTH
jgi:hypothetical protein